MLSNALDNTAYRRRELDSQVCGLELHRRRTVASGQEVVSASKLVLIILVPVVQVHETQLRRTAVLQVGEVPVK